MPTYSEKKIVLHRNQLYAEVWKTPMLTLSKRYGLSDVGLRKICKRLKVPVPKVGHWQRVKFGKMVSQPRLPAIALKDLAQVEVAVRERLIADEETERTIAECISREKRPDVKIVVGPSLYDPHPLVSHTLKVLSKVEPDDMGWIKPRGVAALDLAVGKGNVDRALRIFDSLIKAIEKRGGTIVPELNPYKSSCRQRDSISWIVWMGERIQFRILEALTTVKEKSRFFSDTYRTRFQPKGQLVLRIETSTTEGCRRTWSDRSSGGLEEKLNEFLIGVLAVIREKKAEGIILAKQAAIERERRRVREEEEKARREEEARIQDLENLVEAWHKSERVRAFLRAMKEMVIARDGEIAPESERDRMFQWAEGYADSIDSIEMGRTRDPERRSSD